MWTRLRSMLGRSVGGADEPPVAVVRRWARNRGLDAHPSARDGGLVVHGVWPRPLALVPGALPPGDPVAAWRLEWGPSHRDYLPGTEARWSVETGWPTALCVALMPQSLAQRLEDALYARCVGDVRTQLDEQTPPEVRWLMLHPRVQAVASGLPASEWTLVASEPAWAAAWLAPCAAHWSRHGLLVGPQVPCVLSLRRGRLSLRMALQRPGDAMLERSLALLGAVVAALPPPPVPGRRPGSVGP